MDLSDHFEPLNKAFIQIWNVNGPSQLTFDLNRPENRIQVLRLVPKSKCIAFLLDQLLLVEPIIQVDQGFHLGVF